ncbi:MAG: molybdate ABC transporter substrate-binding protein [Actinobacteria bacterium]|nr:molybdate ABC transporter substrate-binding protein [Actinomycetota bacterium]
MPRRSLLLRPLVAFFALLAPLAPLTLITGCGGAPDLTVLAASSLTDVLPELTRAYESETGQGVSLVFGGSNHLAAQLHDGAPADVFLTADTELVPEGVNGVRIAANHLVLAVPSGNPGGVFGPEALVDAELRVAVCAAEVPCGAATLTLGLTLGLTLAPDTEEPSVRAVASRLALGEADVGVVYATDVLAVDGIEPVAGVDLASAGVEYLAVALTPTGAPFVAFLASNPALATLRNHGFSE